MLSSATAVELGAQRLAKRALKVPDQIPGELMMQIGQLLESSRRVALDISEIKQQQTTNAARAEKDREGIRSEMEHVSNRINTIEDEVITIKGSQAEMAKSQAEVKKVTDRVTKWQIGGAGALAVLSIVFGLLGWGLSHFWTKIFGP